MTDRYARQTVLPEVGSDGQARLAKASVLVVGAGGLGCPVLQYLAGAGVGRLIVVDHDRVEETNLHRQPLYTMADIGQLKAAVAGTALQRFNPEISVEDVAERLTPQNAPSLLAAPFHPVLLPAAPEIGVPLPTGIVARFVELRGPPVRRPQLASPSLRAPPAA